MFVNGPVVSASGTEKIWNVFIHNLVARRFSMPKFRWPELNYGDAENLRFLTIAHI